MPIRPHLIEHFEDKPCAHAVKKTRDNACYRDNDLTEVSNHIDRWLHKRLGKKSDLILAEWVKLEWLPVRFRTKTALLDIVEPGGLTSDGKVGIASRWEGHIVDIETVPYSTFYFHPKSKALCHHQRKPRKRAPSTVDCVITEPYTQLRLVKGLWYEVKVKPVRQERRYDRVRLQFTFHTAKAEPNKRLDLERYPDAVESKKQLSGKQLAHYNLHNSPE